MMMFTFKEDILFTLNIPNTETFKGEWSFYGKLPDWYLENYWYDDGTKVYPDPPELQYSGHIDFKVSEQEKSVMEAYYNFLNGDSAQVVDAVFYFPMGRIETSIIIVEINLDAQNIYAKFVNTVSKKPNIVIDIKGE